MAHLLLMPAVLADSTEAVLQAWLVQPGESFSVGAELAEIETDKALVELAAEETGVMGKHLIEVGNSVTVGVPIAVIAAEGDSPADIEAALAGGGEKASPAEVTAERAERPKPVSTDAAPPPPTPSETVAGKRLFVSPLVRRLARERGVDASVLTGTGPNGRIVRRDLDAWLASKPTPVATRTPAAAQAAPRVGGAAYEEIPHTAMRRAIARRLTESKSTVPHFYMTTECRVDRLLALRAEVNAVSTAKVSVNDLIVKAVAAAFVRVPDANVIWTDEALRRFDTVDISVAVSTDKGLVTPVVRDVSSLTLTQVSATVGDLVSRARIGRLRQDEIEGGSFSISNLGMYGTREFAAILNPPQSGILAVGAATEQAVVTDGEVTVATVMRCTLSADHRAVDGALAAQWLDAFTKIIENPVTMLV